MGIRRVLFSMITTTTYAGLLDSPETGRLTSATKYGTAFTSLGEYTKLPWQAVGQKHWSRMWSNYLDAPNALRSPSAEKCWAALVPLELSPPIDLTGPPGTRGTVRRLLYPHAIVVIESLEMLADVEVDELAGEVSGLRRGNVWSADPKQPGRNLAGIAGTYRDLAEAELFEGGTSGTPSAETVNYVTAPAAGDAAADLLSLDRPGTQMTVAGLADGAPPSTYVAERLIAANGSGDRQTRVYVGTRGHALWNSTYLADGSLLPANDPIGCLFRNHTELVAQIDALAAIATWGASRMDKGVGYKDSQRGIVGNATRMLTKLYSGKGTYRSEVAKRRIEPLLGTIKRAGRGI